MENAGLTHVDERGNARMVDVAKKESTKRLATARGEISMSREAYHAIMGGNVPKGDVFVVGNSTNQYEFQKSFEVDNIVVSIASILIVLVVLLFTFSSAGMPVLLIAVIQGAI